MEAAEASSRVDTAAVDAKTTSAPAKGVGVAEKAETGIRAAEAVVREGESENAACKGAAGTGAEAAEAKTKLGAVESALREEEAWDAT